MEYFILWAVFGCAAYSIAKGKNRRGILWFFIGLLIGPFTVLLVAVMKPGPGPEHGRSGRPGILEEVDIAGNPTRHSVFSRSFRTRS